VKYDIYLPSHLPDDDFTDSVIRKQSAILLETLGNNFQFNHSGVGRLGWYNKWQVECEPTMLTFLRLKLNMEFDYEPNTENI